MESIESQASEFDSNMMAQAVNGRLTLERRQDGDRLLIDWNKYGSHAEHQQASPRIVDIGGIVLRRRHEWRSRNGVQSYTHEMFVDLTFTFKERVLFPTLLFRGESILAALRLLNTMLRSMGSQRLDPLVDE